MARITDLTLPHQLFIKAYRFRSLEPVPWSPLSKPLSACRVALLTTAGFYLKGQPPFDPSWRGGDPSFRRLQVRDEGGGLSAKLGDLAIEHRSMAFDRSGIAADYNLALPVKPFLELEEEGVIGALFAEALSFMGSITAPGRLVKETAPEACALLRAGGVEAAFLLPV